MPHAKPIATLLLVGVSAIAIFTHRVSAGTPDDVNRILESFCAECHHGDEAEGDFQLVSSSPSADVDLRQHWHRVWKMVEQESMPPAETAQPKPAARKRLLDWIDAEFGVPFDPQSANHWAFDPPTRPVVPVPGKAIRSKFPPTTPIDAFILSELERRGLKASPPADRRTLIRRVTLDLTGLLPTPEQTRHFLEDAAPTETAFAKVVDRLLCSPHYGERASQHWLDVIRWAETVGFETNAERREAWHYRDWVIDAMNGDHPYDRFIADQLLGDITGQDAALGFLVAGPANLPGQVGRDEEAMRQARQDELDEVIQTVSQALMGLTVGCARCHDHKFDPISQKDYFGMQAIFAGLKYGTRRLRGEKNDRWAGNVPAAQETLSQLRRRLDERCRGLGLQPPLKDVQSESFAPVDSDAIRMEIVATQSGPASLWEFEAWSERSAGDEQSQQNVALAASGANPSASSFALANQTRHFDNLTDGAVDRRQSFPWVSAAGGPAWIQIDFPEPRRIHRVTWHNGFSTPVDYVIKVRRQPQGDWVPVADTRNRQPRMDDRRDPSTVAINGLTDEQVQEIFRLIKQTSAAERELARLSRGPQVYAASFLSSPVATRLLARGDPMRPGAEVPAAPPDVLNLNRKDSPGGNPPQEPMRRQNLVTHLTHSQHPLTARVIVNRLWQSHFGTGLVETPSDFGRMGRQPSHPQLLDWLAVQLTENGWSLKRIHRLIVTSAVYQQSSLPRDHALAVDAESRLLWRFPPRRLDAESIRDAVLASSGKLNRQMHGRGFNLFNQRGGLSDYHSLETFTAEGWRRMIYAHKVRMQAVDVFGAFDCPDAGQMTPDRNESVTPIQSLGLLNSPFVNRQADFFAERLGDMAGQDFADAIDKAFLIALCRPATSDERELLIELCETHGPSQMCRVLFNTSEFVSLR